MKLALPIVLLSLFSSFAWSHAEHDKPRYVSPAGVDEGQCDTVKKPCLTIGYAASKSNKGDIVLVAEGEYHFQDVSDIFYLTSSLIKINGGYSTTDGYKQQNTKRYPTYLKGIPAQYVAQIEKKGFRVVSDMKSMSKKQTSELNAMLASVKALSQKQSGVACDKGMADVFPCNSMDLVSHFPLNQMSSGPDSANDVWGHVDLNSGIEYALIGLKNSTAIFNLTDPENPTEVATVPGLVASWRDIKVYQYYSEADSRWFAYAYVSTDGAADGVAIIDLNELPRTATLVKNDLRNTNAHNVYISNVDYSTGVAINDRTARLHVLGSNVYGGAHRSYSLETPKQPTEAYVPTDKTRNDYTHDGSSMVVTDERVATQCEREGDECDVFLDFNEGSMRLWDQTVPTETSQLSSISYQNAEYVHSGWWTEDQRYVFLHDELDEMRNSLNTTVRVFDVSNLKLPSLAATWTGPTTAIDHNGYVRGNRYYMSNYERGITVLDITNPEAPSEIGFFDTFPTNDTTVFNGAWGVYPFLPSGLILASDINSGLYVIKDNTRSVSQGSVQFTEANYNVTEGSEVNFSVERVNGSTGAITVEYETYYGSASGDDFTSSKGFITWADGETGTKDIQVLVALDTDDTELAETFSMRLFNVQGGATLGQHKMSWATIAGGSGFGSLSFTETNLDVYEGKEFSNNAKTFDIALNRSFATDQAISLEIGLLPVDGNAPTDITVTQPMASWAADENGEKTIQVTVVDDTEVESTETFTLFVNSSTPTEANFGTTMTITIYDDESNSAPTVVATDYSATLLQNFNLRSRITVTDDDSDHSYFWEVVSGPSSARLADEETEFARIWATETGEYVVRVTVTDSFGESASADMTLSVAPAPRAKTKTINGSMSLTWLIGCFSLIFIQRRRFWQTRR